ncbi:MAG TPA: prepilin-type N-terminal cleavage/methylation domain-containing protein [Steroidobacteraceae bacterium]|nr:prepilin-type N-terminal cleavage/methylation domain-containing protein [Steroidobacteraceae bacterium]
MHRSSQHGFTLIELVVVIIVLGVLAAFAVPRFMGIDTQARIASVNSLAGTLRSTATMAHSVYLARGNPANPVVIDGQNINFVNAYPDAATVGLLLAPGTVTVNNLAGAFTNAAGTFTLNGATTPANCGVTYTAAPANGDPTIATVPANLGGGAPQVVGGC